MVLRLRNEDTDAQVNYSHNFGPTIGIGAMIVGVNFLVSYKIPGSYFRDPEKHGEPDIKSFHLNLNAKKIVAGIDYQYLEGFYLSKTREIPSHSSSGHGLMPSLSVERANFNATWIFRPDKLSYRSVITHADRQLKSAGSFLFNFDINYLKLSGNGFLVPEFLQDDFQSPAGLKKGNFKGTALMPGYSYTFVHKGYYLNLGFAAGPQLWYSDYLTPAGEGNEWKLRGKADLRGGLGYDGGKFFSGIYFLMSRNSYNAGGLDIINDSSLIRFSTGLRFQDAGWMKDIRDWKLYRRIMGLSD